MIAPSLAAGPTRIVRILTRMNIGGPAIHAALLSTRLDPARFSTCLVVGEPDTSEGELTHLVPAGSARLVRIPTLRRPIRPWADLWSFIKLVRVLRRERPHIVHTHMAKAGTLGRLAALCANRLACGTGSRGRALLIHTFHGHVLSGYFGRVHTWGFTRLERWLAARTDVLIAISPSVRQDLLRLGIGRSDQIRVLPLGLDLAPFLRPEPAGHTLKEALGLAPQTRLVGMVGRLVPIKQPELLLGAAQIVLPRYPDVRFIIVGDGERRAHLERLARQLGIEHAVIFVGWRSDLPSIYAELDCVCSTSRNEGTPVSAIEAMACARPVVATAVGGVPDLLGPIVERRADYDVAERGVLVQLQAREHGVAAAIERVLADASLRQRIGQAGRTFVSRSLTAERLVYDISQLYQTLLAGQTTTRNLPAEEPSPPVSTVPQTSLV